MLKLGSHVSFNKKEEYLVGAAKEAYSYGANTMMIYLGAPQNARRAKKEDMRLEEYEKEWMDKVPKDNILVHAPYIVNPTSVTKHGFAIEFLIKEIEIMNYLGLKQLVLHPGAFTKFTREESLDTLVSSLKEILKKTKEVSIHIETMSGKGTEVGTSLEEVRWIYDQVNSDRLGVCLDTCHIWDAGYDVNDFDDFMQELKDKKVLEIIKSLHINGSKNDIASHRDRHENLGSGYIPTATLKKFVHAKEFDNLIKVLETPWVDGEPPYKKEIALLK